MSEIKESSMSIPRKAFESKDVIKVSEYKIGEPVTRDNFASLIIRSFAVSRGSMASQEVFLRWVQDKTGFEWASSLSNYLQAGGFQCLADAEKEIIKTQFDKVKDHPSEYGSKELGIKIDGQLSFLIPTVEDEGTVRSTKVTQFLRKFGTLSSMSYEDLISNLGSNFWKHIDRESKNSISIH